MLKTVTLRYGILIVSLIGLSGCADMRTGKVAAQAGDYQTARAHYTKLSEFGIPEAQMELAMLDIKGLGDNADPKRGLALLESAAANNDPRATFEVGKVYQDGKIVERNYAKARAYYNRALDLDYTRAYYQLGTISEDEKAYVKAESLYKQAYSTGYSRAAVKIASFYKNGRGHLVDKVQALAWYYAAQDGGIAGLEDNVAELETELGPGKVAEARDISKGPIL